MASDMKIDWDFKLAFVSSTVAWMKKFEVLDIPKETKLSYFLKPVFLNSVLEYLLDVNERVSKNIHQPLTINEEINTLKKSPLESFLDIVSIEFNKHDGWKLIYNDDPDQEHDREKTEKYIEDTMLYQVEILNKFLTQIDVEILSSWTNDAGICDENENYDINTIGKHLFKNAKSLIWNINSDDNYNNEKNADDDEDDIQTLRTKEVMRYKKKSIKDEFSIEKKIPSEIYKLEMVDLLDLIDQLYLFMSVIFCIGVLGKREAWGKAQVCFLDEPYKSVLKQWCNLEAHNNYLDLDSDGKEDLKSTISLNLESALLGNVGWMNVSGTANTATDSKLIKELEILRNQVKEYNDVKEIVKEVEYLREQVKETEILREKAKQVDELRDQVKEVEKLKEQVKEIGKLREQVKEINYLKERAKEIEPLNFKIVDLTVKAEELAELKTQYKNLKDVNIKLLNQNESQETTQKTLTEIISKLKKTEEETLRNNLKQINDLTRDHELHIHEYQLKVNELNQIIKQLKQEIVKESTEENRLKINFEKQIKGNQNIYTRLKPEVNNEKENFDNVEMERRIEELVEEVEEVKIENSVMLNDLKNYKQLLEDIYQSFIEIKNKFILSNSLRGSEIIDVVDKLEKLQIIVSRNEHQIKGVDNFKDLIKELDKGDATFKEFTIRIYSNNKIKFINSLNELIEVDKLSLKEGKKIEVRFNIEFLLKLLTEKEEIEEIRLMYKKVLLEQLSKYLLLKNCCKILRSRNLEYIEKIKLLVERDEEVWRWYKISENRFKENRVEIEKLIYNIEVDEVGREEVLFELKLISEEIKINLDTMNLDNSNSKSSYTIQNKAERETSRITSTETRIEN